MPAYSIVEDSHRQKYLKEEGYGFVARVLVNPEGEVSVVRQNKGVDMDPHFLIDQAEALLPKPRRRR